ncbi:hypothetical protein ANCDUO_17165 [Ancylostoma duodenale]|uniref:Uncharacterized protein n=1 Tax=Ancylostoma duodenale TaxID=51022 RepID=A0A0C2G6M8_9BILA|nr:hypothetical protein ANCDUO_17165 [Ancylostoma duodenale]
MLCIWRSAYGVEYWELLAEGSTVTGDAYTKQPRNLKTNFENARTQQHKLCLRHDQLHGHSFAQRVLMHHVRSFETACSKG